jgi:hypothetical protein
VTDSERAAELRRRIREAEGLPRASTYADAAELLHLEGQEADLRPGHPPFPRDALEEKIRDVREDR